MIRHLLASTLLVGCATSFTGSPHIDPATCQQKCGASQMQMTGMVYMGEYSSACICEVPRAAPLPSPAQPAPPPAAAAPSASAAAAAGAAGVVMQMRRAAAQSAQR